MAVDPERIGQPDPVASVPAVVLGAGLAVAALSLLAAALEGAPYLSLSSLNPWIGVFSVAGFVVLFAVPFLISARHPAGRPDHFDLSERAMAIWGAVAVGLLIPAGLMIWASGSTPAASLLCATGTVLAIEAGMIAAVLLVWILSG